MPADRAARRRARLVEWCAALVALALAIGVVAHLVGTERAVLLFSDGDSMLPVLVMRSIEQGLPQDWAMSSVLFLPELAVFGVLWSLRLGPDATIVLNAVVNLLALYGALRLAAGRREPGRTPALPALLAFTGFAVLAVLDGSASRDSLELASLLATTTYYSATVLGAIVAIGLVRRMLSGSARPRATAAVLGAVAAVSVLTNPLFLLWATGPLGLLLGLPWLRRDPAARRQSGRRAALLALAVGSVVGYGARIPFAGAIANDGWGYIRFSRIGDSAGYYGALVAERWAAPAGAAALLLTAALLVVAVVSGIRLRAQRDLGARFVAQAGWVLPLVVLAAAILLGTNAARYLQPAVFAPVTALVAVPAAFAARRVDAAPLRSSPRAAGRRRALPAAAAAAAVLALVAAGVAGVPRLVAAAARDDADLDCVTAWVDASGRTGAGQYWTVRLPTSRLADLRRLVQVDAALNPYDWLVVRHRSEVDVDAVSFLVLDAQSSEFLLPGGARLGDASVVRCGRYTIVDFGERILPLGTPHS